MKRIFAFLLVLCLLIGVSACAGKQPNTPDDETPTGDDAGEPQDEDPTPADEPKQNTTFSGEEKVMDIYLIAGQSNASGHTKIVDEDAAYEFAKELKAKKGFTNVLFSGRVRWDYVDGSGQYYYQDYSWRKTILGLGKEKNFTYIGPEAGMAKGLAEYYNKDNGVTAGIIKYGHGGTSLLRKVQNLGKTDSNQFGSWVPPTYAEEKYGMDALTYEKDLTGALYREFLEVIRKELRAVTAQGFTNVNIKGLYWMQGENDRGQPEEYKKAFEYFVSDFRRDLAEIVKELTGGDDRGAANMPIFVGTISQTQNLNAANAEETNKAFIEMQKALPNTVENCYVIDNSQYRISEYNGTKDAKVFGSDQWHWNQADHLEIGYNVGQKMLEVNGLK